MVFIRNHRVLYGATRCIFCLIFPAFFVAIVACQGKLERIPFDLPEAETEIASGTFVEYSGRYYAIFKIAIDCELVVVTSLITAVYLPLHPQSAFLGFLSYILQTFVVLFILALFRTIMARVRIEQMVVICWKYLDALSFATDYCKPTSERGVGLDEEWTRTNCRDGFKTSI